MLEHVPSPTKCLLERVRVVSKQVKFTVMHRFLKVVSFVGILIPTNITGLTQKTLVRDLRGLTLGLQQQ